MKLLLLPGMEGSGKLFEGFVKALVPSIEPLVVGYPTGNEQSYESLLKGIPIPEEKFVVLAESFSGPLGIRIAAQHRDRVRALILVASFVRNPSRMPRVAAPFLTKWLFARRIQPVMLWLSGAGQEARRQILEAMATVPPEALMARTRTVLSEDARQELRSVSAPVLYLRGKHDCVVTQRSMREIRAGLPATRVVELDAHHFVLQERAQEAARVVCDFLASAI